MPKHSLIAMAVLMFFGASSFKLLSETSFDIPILLVPVVIFVGVFLRRFPRAWERRRESKNGDYPLYKYDFGALPKVLLSATFWAYGCLYPLLEELAFRGTLFNFLSEQLSIRDVIATSAVAFSLWHIANGAVIRNNKGQGSHFLQGCLEDILLHIWGGLIYATAYAISGNLWVGWAIHLISNTILDVNDARWRAVIVTLFGLPGPVPTRLSEIPGGAECAIVIHHAYTSWDVVGIPKGNGPLRFDFVRSLADIKSDQLPFFPFSKVLAWLTFSAKRERAALQIRVVPIEKREEYLQS